MPDVEAQVLDSDTVVLLAETGLHLMIICAILARLDTKAEKIIFWTGDGAPPKFEFDWSAYECRLFHLPNYSQYSFFDLGKLARQARLTLSDFVRRKCTLLTYYDTSYSFEIIRHVLNVPWSRIALLDDGQANYLPEIGMPDYKRRWLKHVFNRVNGRFPVNTSKYNLGGNNKIKLAYAVAPAFYYRGTNDISIIDISKELREFLIRQADASSNLDADLKCIVSLSPIYSYDRVSKDELFEYLRLVEKASDSGSIGIKVHPRDLHTQLVADLQDWSGAQLVILPNLPTELFFEELWGINWFGSPSTSMLYRHFLYPDRSDKFYVSQFGTATQFADKQISTFRKVMGEKFISIGAYA